MKKLSLFVTTFSLICLSGFSQYSKTRLQKDVFGTRTFVENKGQFNKAIESGEQVLFAYESANEHIYFTPAGPVYKLIKRFKLNHEQFERIEKGKKVVVKPNENHFVKVNWQNANKNIQVIHSDAQNHYFSYGAPELNSYTFKKITYKNVYNNIDIEYTFPEDKEYGIKYSIILHPGANPADIKIAYTGEVNKITNQNGQIIIKTPLEDITEHAPLSFYENNQSISSVFNLDNNVISFQFPNGFQNNRTVIIDPFVTTLPSLTNNNYAYDVDYDGSGNLFVYGGVDLIKVAKYSPAGVLIWTFAGSVPGISWDSQGNGNDYVGNFIVNKINGKTYLGQGFEPNPGSRVVRLDAAGNYDNFVTTVVPAFRELWDMGFHCGTGQVYGLGGTTASNISAGLIDQNNGNMTTNNFTGLPSWGQDVVSNAIDDLGNVFIIFASNGTPSANNALLRINGGFNGNIWFQASTYSVFQEANNKGNYVGVGLFSNGFNCLAVNANYLFYYDGLNLAAYDKNTGVKLPGWTTIPGHTVKRQGGIAVDDCNNIYIGGNDNILCYNYNGTSFSTLPGIPMAAPSANKYVYDIKLDRNAKTLYVCGSGFAGTYNAINSMTCGVANAFSLSVNCAGFNNGTAVATLTTSVANPTINYIWTSGNTTVAATMSTAATSNTVLSLPNGTYSVLMQVNAPCGPAYSNTFTVNCCPSIVLTPTIVQGGCTNPVNSASLSIAGGGTLVPTITWSPTPGSIAGNSLSATGLPLGSNTVLVNYGAGCVSSITFSMLPPPPPITFTVNNLTGSNTITCLNPAISLQVVSNYTYGTLTYSWTSPSFTANTTTVSISAANQITLTVTDPATGCIMQQVIAIGINTTAPTNSVNPPSQAITCNSGSPVTFSGTVINPSINIQHDWYSPLNPLPNGVPIATSNNTLSILSGLIPPGIYTLETTNLVNGCKSQKTVTVTSLSAWPTFNVASPTNFSVGCSPLNQTTISIINPVSTQTPPATCSYTFLPPSFVGVVTPSVILGGNTSTVTMIPGTWTIIVQDNSNWCRTTISVPIIQNTVAPNVSASLFTPTLTCRNPTVIATGTSTTPNTVVTWNIPQNPPQLSTHTVEIGPITGPNTSTTSLTYANYTVVATNTLNACQTTSVVQIYQNFKPPVSSPTISIGTPTAIYCNVLTSPAVLTTGSSTTTSGGGASAFVANPCWQGPSPQASVCGVSSYSCYVPGIYTLTIQDNYNGCYNSGTVQVLDRTQPPIITNTFAPGILDCGSGSAALSFVLTGTNTGGVRYLVVDYPFGAAFTPSNAITYNVNPILSGTSSSSITVSMAGIYHYAVTNTLTSCKAYGYFEVTNGAITASFTPDPEQGYPPLMVTFTNNSFSSIGSASITSVWSFGNGITQTTTNNINTSTTYSAPGNYTVMLLTTKGTCIDTTYKVIKVELPSKLEAPNIFTPNGDGSNDVFFLKVANLGEINATVFDRWGNKVYETNSKTGNIAWDGKNFGGKECASGVYFYVITATGNDAKEYKVKGNVSLFR